MNEEQKNIETCLAEDILSEVANVPTDQQFRSLVEESFDPLKQQALQQAGYDGYEKVVWTHKPYTFTSSVRQMKSNLILLLRRLWRFSFGRGTIRSLADMWQHYITRLKGNPEYCIPSRLASLTDLPSAPALLSDRKIGGVPEAADGMSLVHLLCSSTASEITELVDDNLPWGELRKINLISIFVNLRRLQLNCESVNFRIFDGATGLEHFAMPYFKRSTYYGGLFYNSFKADTDLDFPMFDYVTFGSNFTPCISGCLMRTFKAENMKIVRSTGTNSPMFYNCPNLEEIDFRSLEYCNHWGVTTRGGGLANNCPKLWKVIVGDLSYGTIYGTSGTSANGMGFPDCPKLIYIEVGANGKPVSVDMDMRWWSPTLDSSNLQQFLSNFKTYIAQRLTDKGTGLTLTLSQEVRNAIHAAEDEYGIENIIITKKGWTISPAPN